MNIYFVFYSYYQVPIWCTQCFGVCRGATPAKIVFLLSCQTECPNTLVYNWGKGCRPSTLQNAEAQRDRKSFPSLNINLFILLHLQLICSFLRCMQMWKMTWILCLVQSFNCSLLVFPVSLLALPLLAPSCCDLPSLRLVFGIHQVWQWALNW